MVWGGGRREGGRGEEREGRGNGQGHTHPGCSQAALAKMGGRVVKDTHTPAIAVLH